MAKILSIALVAVMVYYVGKSVVEIVAKIRARKAQNNDPEEKEGDTAETEER